MLKTFFIAFYLLFLIIIPAKVGDVWFNNVASTPKKGISSSENPYQLTKIKKGRKWLV